MSSSLLFLFNAVATVPVGIVGLLFPGFLFAQFGLTDIEPSSEVLIRGYMATCLSYGCIMGQLRKSEHEYELLIASALFNVAETMIQIHAVLSDAGFSKMIWITVTQHGILAIWTLWNLTQRSKMKEV